MSKTLTLLATFLGLSLSLAAQDKIIMKNGDLFQGKVLEVGHKVIRYTKNDSLGGVQLLSISKNKTEKILFAGTNEVTIGNKSQENQGRPLGRHIITLSPFKGLDLGFGYGLSYEYQMDKKGQFAAVIPFSLIISDSHTYYRDAHVNSTKGIYASPGLKFYPFGQKKVSYAMGTNLIMGWLSEWHGDEEYLWNLNKEVFVQYKSQRTRMGLLVNNYLNLQMTKNLQIGIHAGLGRLFLDHTTLPQNDLDYRYYGDDKLIGEFSFNIAFRF